MAETKQNSIKEAKSATPANEQVEEREIKIKRTSRLSKKNKILLIICVVLSLLLGVAALTIKFVQFSYQRVNDLTQLNYTVAQISQIVDNIRQVYMIHGSDMVLNNNFLLKSGAVPKSLIKNGRIVNPYGGDIVILPSVPIENKKEQISSPTFKMSYQGLEQKVCINLALLNWGDLSKGLQAVATGYVDGNGEDVALTTIDNPPEPDKPEEYLDAQGQLRRRPVRPKYHFNVAKPNDKFSPTPFPFEKARAGCACAGGRFCSFALQYMIYAVDNPNKVEDALTAARKALQKQ